MTIGKPYHKNPRTISRKRHKRLEGTLVKYGDLSGIVHNLETDEIIGGNQRVSIFENGTVELVEQFDEPDEQGTVGLGFIIWKGKPYSYRQVRWDKKTAEEANIEANLAGGDWDFDILANQWGAGELINLGFDEDLLTNWQQNSFALGDLLGSENGEMPGADVEPQMDKAEELQEKWQVKPDDIWQMDEHRLICGDCREPGTWERLLDGQKVNGVFTSPPYAEQRKKQYGGVPVDEYVDWWEIVQSNIRMGLEDDGSFFMNIKPHCEDGQRVLYVMDLVLAMVRRWGWRLVDELCWTHEGIPGKWANRLKNGFEPIYHFSMHNKIKLIHRNIKHISNRSGHYTASGVHQTSTGNVGFEAEVKPGLALPNNVLRILHGEGRQDNVKHSAKFPLKLPTFFIKAYSNPGDIWLDPFIGSGTTIMACENEGRIGYGIEQLEKYCAVVLQRWADLTGQQPQLLE